MPIPGTGEVHDGGLAIEYLSVRMSVSAVMAVAVVEECRVVVVVVVGCS